MGKRTMGRALTAALGALILLFCFCRLSALLEDKDNRGRMQAFFDETQQIDVLLMGSSHVRYAIFPMELYRDEGIVSYNLAGNGDTIPVAYWKLRMAMEYQKPKLVVMDVYDLWPGAKTSENGIGQVHTSMDAFPLSIEKVRAVMDLFDDRDDRLEMLIKFCAYHTRWSELTRSDVEINYNSSICKGAYPLGRFVRRNPKEDKTPDAELVYGELSREYLEKMIRLCRDSGAEVLLINTGYDASKETRLFAESIPALADEYGIRYLDFTAMDLIDFNTDLQTSGDNTHVNSSGARKLTAYVGDQISELFDIPDRREDAAYAGWDLDYETYRQFKIEYIAGSQSYLNELTALSDPDFSLILYLPRNSNVWGNEDAMNLFQNTCLVGRLEKLEAASQEKRAYLAILDNLGSQIFEISGGSAERFQTAFGEISACANGKDDFLCLGDSDNSLKCNSTFDAQVLLIDNATGKIAARTCWKDMARVKRRPEAACVAKEVDSRWKKACRPWRS